MMLPRMFMTSMRRRRRSRCWKCNDDVHEEERNDHLSFSTCMCHTADKNNGLRTSNLICRAVLVLMWGSPTPRSDDNYLRVRGWVQGAKGDEKASAQKNLPKPNNIQAPRPLSLRYCSHSPKGNIDWDPEHSVHLATVHLCMFRSHDSC